MKAIQQAAPCRKVQRNAQCADNARPNDKKRARALAVALKYALLTAIGLALFEWGRAYAFAQRGYEAIGGEMFFPLLPLIWFCVESTIRDAKQAAQAGRKEEGDE